MAKELGLSPQSLRKNWPSPSQSWKLPVKEWILELYEKTVWIENGYSGDRQPFLIPAGIQRAGSLTGRKTQTGQTNRRMNRSRSVPSQT